MNHSVVRWKNKTEAQAGKFSESFIIHSTNIYWEYDAAFSLSTDGSRQLIRKDSSKLEDSLLPANDKSVASPRTHLLWSEAQIVSPNPRSWEADHYQFFFLSTVAEA